MQALKDLTDAANVPKILVTSNYMPGKIHNILVVLMYKKVIKLDQNVNV